MNRVDSLKQSLVLCSQLARATCSSQLSPELFEDCVIDVAVTQDREMAEQGVYKPGKSCILLAP